MFSFNGLFFTAQAASAIASPSLNTALVNATLIGGLFALFHLASEGFYLQFSFELDTRSPSEVMSQDYESPCNQEDNSQEENNSQENSPVVNRQENTLPTPPDSPTLSPVQEEPSIDSIFEESLVDLNKNHLIKLFEKAISIEGYQPMIGNGNSRYASLDDIGENKRRYEKFADQLCNFTLEEQQEIVNHFNGLFTGKTLKECTEIARNNGFTLCTQGGYLTSNAVNTVDNSISNSDNNPEWEPYYFDQSLYLSATDGLFFSRGKNLVVAYHSDRHVVVTGVGAPCVVSWSRIFN